MTENIKHNYGIDLVRIVAMLMIIAHHFSLHSGFEFNCVSANSVFLDVLALGGKTGVNIFILITGFCSAGKIKNKKLINLIGNATLYSVILTMIASSCGYVAYSKKMFLKACFPFLFGNNYWFIVTYLELYILSPLLNVVVSNLDEKKYQRYLVFFTCLLCVFPSIVVRFIQINDFGYNSLIWFIYLYFIGSYLKLYGLPNFFRGYETYLPLLTSCFILVHILACIGSQVYTETNFANNILECLADYDANAIMPLFIAISMFLIFEKVEVHKGKRLLRKVSTATLGVYLFHDNVNFRLVLWDLCKVVLSLNEDNVLFMLSSIACIVIVFVTGTVIELMKDVVVKKVYYIAKVSKGV